MAKETKLMREHRQAEEQLARVEAEQTNYLPRVMLALEAATKLGFSLEVKDGKFVVNNHTGWSRNPLKLSVKHSEDDQDTLESLEWDVDCFAKEEAEAERKFAVKQAALAKLSKEERDLLGV